MTYRQKIAIMFLLPTLGLYLTWLIVSGLRSGQAYFPRIGYYSRQLQPAAFWGLISLTLLLAIAFVTGWLMLLMEYMAH